MRRPRTVLGWLVGASLATTAVLATGCAERPGPSGSGAIVAATDTAADLPGTGAATTSSEGSAVSSSAVSSTAAAPTTSTTSTTLSGVGVSAPVNASTLPDTGPLRCDLVTDQMFAAMASHWTVVTRADDQVGCNYSLRTVLQAPNDPNAKPVALTGALSIMAANATQADFDNVLKLRAGIDVPELTFPPLSLPAFTNDDVTTVNERPAQLVLIFFVNNKLVTISTHASGFTPFEVSDLVPIAAALAPTI